MPTTGKNNATEHHPLARILFLPACDRFCRLNVRIFNRQFEVTETETIPKQAGLIFCANHVNALIDLLAPIKLPYLN